MRSNPSYKSSADPLLLLIIIGLVLFGLMMVGSASSVVAERFRGGDTYFFLKHQLTYGVSIGAFMFLVGYFVPYRKWKIFALPALLLSLFLLVLVFIPGLSFAYGETARWIRVGPITIQPTEFTKMAFIVYLAALLEKKRRDIGDFKQSVLPFLVITGVICLLIIMQPDIGTLFTITAIAMTMVFAAGFKIKHLAFIGFLGAALFAILVKSANYRLNRLMVFLHPELDPQGIGYQINQALLAVGTGGLWGQGLGRSRQKYQYLPEPAGDSIFAIMAEEMGFIRTMIVVTAFLFIAYKGYDIARKAPDTFGQLMATGITSWIIIQAIINMGAIMALMPLTGIPLPFISFGGSALAANLFSAGILLNISKFTK